MPENADNSKSPVADRHLWQIAAVRDAIWLLAGIAVLLLVYWLRAILAPIAVAFALAYVVDPVVRFAQDRLQVRRVYSATALLVLLIVAGATVLSIALPQVIAQIEQLAARLPAYLDWVAGNLQIESWQAARDVATQPASDDPGAFAGALLSGTGRVFGFIGTVFDTVTYMVASTLLVIVLFGFFVVYFERVPGFKDYLPASQRDTIWDMLLKVDAAFSAYIRGQFVVALFTTSGFCLGFYLASVPYWFIVSLIGGTLSLIPYGQMSGWILAVALKYLETQTADGSVDFTWWGVVLAPSLVYLVTQSMESWVITPLVQGESANLHPVVVILVLIVGGYLAGVVGLVLAIPLTASGRLIFQQYIEPRWRNWVEQH